MKNSDIHDLINCLQGFDGDELQREMTDGLDEWCRQRQQRERKVKRVVLVALLLLTTTAIAKTAIPWIRSALRSASQTETPVSAIPPAPRLSVHPSAVTQESPADSVSARPSTPQPVDYYYTGIAEDGYSVAYGHETRTVTYTRYSGSHIISSVIHNVPDALFVDTAALNDSAPLALSSEADSLSQMAVSSMIKCDFQTVDFSGDVLYFTVIDSVQHHVSVRGDVAQWMGQTIRYSDTLVIPASVEFHGITYTVTTLADSAFARHAELQAIVLPATITSIENAAFAHCTGLGALSVLSVEPPEVSPTAFNRTDANMLLLVPCGSLMNYEDTIEWLYFRQRKERCL